MEQLAGPGALIAAGGLEAEAAELAHFGGRGHLRQRPAVLHDAAAKQPTLAQAEGRVALNALPLRRWALATQ